MEIRERKTNDGVFHSALSMGLESFQASILAARTDDHINTAKIVYPELSYLHDPSKLKGIDKATQRIADAVINKEKIIILSDWDSDGLTGCSLALDTLKNYFHVEEKNAQPLIGDRTKEAFGISDDKVEKILTMNEDELPSLIVSVDCGSGNYKQIEKIKAQGIDLIVTDHLQN